MAVIMYKITTTLAITAAAPAAYVVLPKLYFINIITKNKKHFVTLLCVTVKEAVKGQEKGDNRKSE